MAQIDLKNATIFLRDGDSPVNELEINVGEGTLQFTEKKTREYTLNRGVLSTGSVRDGDDEPVEVSLDILWETLVAVSGGPITPREFLKGTGAGLVTSGADDCEPYCCDIVIEYVPPCDSTTPEVITLSEFRYESIDYDAKAGTLSVKGKCKITEATVIRTAVS